MMLLYAVTTLMCLNIVKDVLVFPASYRIGDPQHAELMVSRYRELKNQGKSPKSMPLSIFTKYQEHRAVRLTHLFPAAVWSATIPLQLYPGVRKKCPQVHKMAGYVFFASCFLLMIGLGLIISRGLMCSRHDFPPLGVPVPDDKFSIASIGIANEELVALSMGLWFTYTALAAVLAARRGDFVRHQQFAVRHIGSGIWVAIHRLLFVDMLTQNRDDPPAQIKSNFDNATIVSLALCTFVAELVVRRDLSLGRRQHETARTTTTSQTAAKIMIKKVQ